MATKWKKISTHLSTRCIAFLLALAMLAMFAWAVCDLVFVAYRNELEPEALVTPDFEASGYYFNWIDGMLWDLLNLAEGSSVDWAARELSQAGALYYLQTPDGIYKNIQQPLTPANGRWISIVDGEMTVHLLRSDQPEYYEFGVYGYHEANREGFAGSQPVSLFSDGVSAYLYLSDDLVAYWSEWWSYAHNTLMRGIVLLVCFAVPALVLSLYLCLVTGRTGVPGELRPGRLDRVWSEVLLAAFAAAAFASFFCAIFILDESIFHRRGFWGNQDLVTALCILSVCAGYALSMPFLLALIRKCRARTVFTGSAVAAVLRLVRKLLRGVAAFFRALFDGTVFQRYPFVAAIFWRRAAYVGGSLLCVLLFFLGIVNWVGVFCIFAVILEIAITWWFLQGENRVLRDTEAVFDQISHIADGELDWSPQLPERSPLSTPSGQLSQIGGGMQKSVERQIASERMKVELVTNVSHDLKTPLTSIVSYVELLSKMEDLPPEAREYVDIVAQKSDRLGALVSDLFELAKSTSGSMEMQWEALDLRRLVEQTLAEMQERIDQSGLAVRLSLADPPVTIWADGRKLYRVLQNVVDNALKYSMAGTRVYIGLAVAGGRATLTVKNTAAYEMDFTAEEITERFARGDKARTAEGSGLGLSIAQSFTRACGGQFAVDVDGDQFKVTIAFDLYNMSNNDS